MLACTEQWPFTAPHPAPSHPLLQSASSELCPCLGRENFGEVITCRTGEYRADKVPSGLLPVKIHYGKSTTKTIADDPFQAFQFMENPTVLDHQPKGSFVWSVQQKRVPLQCNISWFWLIVTVSVPVWFINVQKEHLNKNSGKIVPVFLVHVSLLTLIMRIKYTLVLLQRSAK